MAGAGAPILAPVAATDVRVAIVAASWHETVMNGLLAGALRGCAASAVRHPVVVRVPGSFELPVAASRLARSGRFDALIALGVVIRGGTPHFEYVCAAAAQGLTSVSVEAAIPVGFGLLTCDDVDQALDRAGLATSREDKGYEAAAAAIQTALALSPYRVPVAAAPTHQPGTSSLGWPPAL